MESVDITIIGAGVVGLSVASEVAGPGRDVFILEKNDSFGQETSSRNSEVIHAGIYYQPGSLKALACVEGRNILYELCQTHNIPFKKIGKIIVAVDPSEMGYLAALQKKAAQNGVALTFLETDGLKKMEPEVIGIAGLYSSETGIVDSHSLMKFFLDKAKAKGAELVVKAEVVGIQRQGLGYRIEVDNQGERFSLESRVVINSAGLNADRIAALCGIDIVTEKYQQYYLKGDYFRLSDRYANLTQHLVYPVPLENSLGIHTVRDLRGGLRLGPDEEEVDELDYRVDEKKKSVFYASVKKFLPIIEEGALYPDTAGIRPQLRFPNNGDFKDFIIRHEVGRGFPGLVNLVGIESPGLTSSPYIGICVARMLEKIL